MKFKMNRRCNKVNSFFGSLKLKNSKKVEDFKNLKRFEKIKQNGILKMGGFSKRIFKNVKKEAKNFKKIFFSSFKHKNNFEEIEKEDLILEQNKHSELVFKLKKIRKIKKCRLITPIKKRIKKRNLVEMSLSEIFQRTIQSTLKKQVPFLNQNIQKKNILEKKLFLSKNGNLFSDKKNIKLIFPNNLKNEEFKRKMNFDKQKTKNFQICEKKVMIKKNSFETNYSEKYNFPKNILKDKISLKMKKIYKFKEIEEKFNVKINLITPFFQNLLQKQEFANLNQLNKIEKKLMFYIISRKMKNCKKRKIFQKMENLDIENLLHIYKNSIFEKRFEEVFKFGFKFFINNKIMIFKEKFPENSSINSDFIYNYYFTEISKKMKISIYEFFDPTKKTQKHPYIKTFGKKYLKLILKSEIFKKDFLYFLENDLKKFYYKELEKKIKNMFFQLFNKFEIFKNKNFHEKFSDDILFEKNAYNYFVQNSQCKIPWSSVEIDYSIKKLESYITALMHQ